MILILLITAGLTRAVNGEEIEAPVRTEVAISLRLVDEEGKVLTGEKMVLVEVSRGGLKDPTVFSSGLPVREGTARFVYLTPATPGPAEVRILEPETLKLLKKVTFHITGPAAVLTVEEKVQVTKVTGRVEVYPDGRWLRGGEKLAAGYQVITDEESWLSLKVFDGWEVVVQPLSSLRLIAVESSAVPGGRECRLELDAGKIYVATQGCTGEDVFQVQAAGAAVYAHGHDSLFEVVLSGQGPETIVYYGEALLEETSNGLLFPVMPGQKAILPEGEAKPAYYSHRSRPEIPAGMRPETGILPAGELVKPPAAAEEIISGTGENGRPGSPYRTRASLTAGTGREYALFSLKPQFIKIGDTAFSCGLDLPLTLNQTTGEVRFGAVHPGVKVDNLVDWVEYAGKNFHLYYGVQEERTYGYGLLFAGYTSPYRKTCFGLRDILGGSLNLELLCPWEIRSFYPWAVEDNFSLYAGRIDAGFKTGDLRLQAGFTYLADYGFKEKVAERWAPASPPGIATQGVAVDLGISWTETFQPYIEWAVLNGFGSGLETGVQGKIGLLRYRAAYRYLGKGFYPNYFGGEYDTHTLNALDGLPGRTLPDLHASCFDESQGYLLGLEICPGPLLALGVSLAGCNREDGYSPIFTGRADLTLPAFGPFPPVTTGFHYCRYRFTALELDALLDENTNYSSYLQLMLHDHVYATLTSTYCPFNQERKYCRELKLELKF